MTKRKPWRRRLLLLGGLTLSFALLGGFVYKYWAGVSAALYGVRWPYLALAAAAAAVSYVFIGLSLWELLCLLGYPLGIVETIGIGFVSTAVNYVLSSAGLSGFALRVYLLRRRHVPYGAMVTASVLSLVFFYSVLALIIGQGMALLLLKLELSRSEVIEGVAGLTALVGLTFLGGFAFFHHELRSKLGRAAFRATNRVIYLFSKAEIPPERFAEFERQIGDGLRMIRGQGARLALAVGYTCGDWLFTLLVLHFAFRAVGYRVPGEELVMGFGAGSLATLIPVLPAGMGAMEPSMAAAFDRMGIPFASALAAALIFRLLYDIVPGLLSLFVFWGLKMSEPRSRDKPQHRRAKTV